MTAQLANGANIMIIGIRPFAIIQRSAIILSYMRKTIEIPEGYEARIENNKVILEPKEKAEEERIRKAIIKHFNVGTDYITFSGFSKEQIIAWLEKQGEKNEHTKHPDMVANLKEYLANTPKEQLEKDWDELKQWNNVGPTVEEFLYGKQNPVWSEEDEKMLNKCIEYASNIVPVKPTKESGLFVDFKRIPDEKAQDFLKSLKGKVLPQPKSEWSEEDERSIRDSIFYLKSAKKYFEKDDDILWDEKWFDSCIGWLETLYKRLQPQQQWKPSEGQMKSLRKVIEATDASVLNAEPLISLVKLENDLKKLKG